MNRATKSSKMKEEYLEIINSFNNRDTKGLEDIYNILQKEVALFVGSLSDWDKELSNDITEDTFINVWLSSAKFKNFQHLRSYLYTTAKNLYLKHIDHNKHVKRHEEEMSKSDTVATFECKVYSIVDEALKELPQSYAEVIRMYLDGYKLSEIATELGRTEQNVYNIKYDAIKKLRRLTDKLMVFLLTI